MRIAIYYPWIYLKSGVERTILETVKRSKHQYTIFTNHYDKKGTYPEFKNLNVIELKRIPVQRDIFSVLQAAIIIIFQKIDLKPFDYLIVHSEGLGDLILLGNNKIPAVCFCYTPLRPVFDAEYKKMVLVKKNMFEKFIYFIFAYIFGIVDRFLWKKYKYIFLISKEVGVRAKRGGLIDNKSKCLTLNPGVDWDNIKPTWKYKKYFFLPGRIMWTKNIELAIKAFKIFEKHYKGKSGFKLIIAGQVDKKSKQYFKKLKVLSKISRNISFIENPTDKKMKTLYTNCYTVLATSFNEDWGLTPIEANAYGKPVLAVNSGGFRESQINNKTGFLIENNSVEFASKMLTLVENKVLTLKLGEYARTHSQKYSWGKFTIHLDQVLNVFPTRRTY